MARFLPRRAQIFAFGCMVWAILIGVGGSQAVLAEDAVRDDPVAPVDRRNPIVYTDAEGNTLRTVSGDAAAQSQHMPANITDDFGYTWDELPQNWFDARSGGTEVGWTGTQETAIGPLSLPFPFKFYENTYTQYWIASGYIAFQPSSPWHDQLDIPSPGAPNAIIAPYATPLGIELPDVKNYIYYKSGGSAPNRYLVVEWYKVLQSVDGLLSDFTYELVLYENGNVMFQYMDMNYEGETWYCGVSGIEDAAGLDGLNIEYDNCARVDGNHSLMITRPAPSAHIQLDPVSLGRFTQANTQEVFEFTVRNTGDLGTDTYNLSVASPWSANFYDAIGAPLTDTDSDGVPDTGPIPQGARRTIKVGVQSPAYVNLGGGNVAIVTATSASNTAIQGDVRIITSFAAPFAQSYIDDAVNLGDVRMALIEPGLSLYRQTAKDDRVGYEIASADLPGGGVAEIWNQYVYGSGGSIVAELFGAIYDVAGNLVQAPRQLTHSSGIANGRVWNDTMAIASTPDGHIGVLWIVANYRLDSSAYNFNTYFMVLSASGVPIYGPVNLSNNSNWGKWGADGWVAFNWPKLVATSDNHFVAAWVREDKRGIDLHDNIDYAVFSNSGSQLRAVTSYSALYSPDTAGSPALVSLADGRVLLLYNGSRGYNSAVLDSNGNIVQGENQVSWEHFWQPDAVQLTNGRIAVVVVYWESTSGLYQLKYMLLDGASLNLVSGPTPFGVKATRSGATNPSVAADLDGRAIVTWTEDDDALRGRVLYALIDSAGRVLSEPMPFITGVAPAQVLPHVEISPNGYGNAPYRRVMPTTDGRDAYVKTSLLAVGAPGGVAPIFLEVGNLGRDPLVDASLTVSMTSVLTFVRSSPAPDAVLLGLPVGAAEESAGTTELKWSLPALDFQGIGRIVLYVQIPDGEVGKRYYVGVTLDAPGDESVQNNDTSLRVMAAEQVQLPEIRK